MYLKSIQSEGVLPIQTFSVDELSDVVVLAGPNGVGKSRLINSLISHLQNPTPVLTSTLIIEATTKEELDAWGQRELNTSVPEDCTKLTATLQSNRLRRNWKSSVLNFESNRTIQKIKPYAFSWDITDPDEESIGWNFTFGGLQNRWQDTLHAILRKVEARRKNR